MILIDPREGSKEILDYINAMPGHPPCQHEMLQYGDAAFTGDGPNGVMLVGIEVKTLNDVLNCIGTQRFTGHQLPGLKSLYDSVYLIIQGEYRANWETGLLQFKSSKGNYWFDVTVGNRSWTHYEFSAWITMVELGWGIRTRNTLDMKDTSRTIIEMYRILQKPWSEHHTLQPFFLGPDIGNTPFVKPSLVERVVAQVEGIGPTKAREIGKRFPTVASMVNSIADVKITYETGLSARKKWADIPGIGKSTIEHILSELWGVSIVQEKKPKSKSKSKESQ